MNVTIEPKSGFCFGVVSAINAAEEHLKKETDGLYCLGHIVHNSQEVERLQNLGLKVIDPNEFGNLENVKVMIRAHGEPPQTYAIAKENNIELIDATCPIVLKLQEKIKKGFSEINSQGGQVLIYGKLGHAEVIGLNGQTQNNAIVISRFEDAIPLNYDKATKLYAQTTMNETDYTKLANYISQRCLQEGGSFEMVNSICKSMSSRAETLQKFSSEHDAIVFVSDKKSSNGQYLYDICLSTNPNTFFITEAEELPVDKFLSSHFNSIGVCGATSTPMWLMESVAQKIKKLSCY